MRGNPGGLLSEAVEVSGLFLDRGSVIAYTRGRSGDSDKYYVADGGDILNGRPLVVLIDGQTASSAEVMAAALREQRPVPAHSTLLKRIRGLIRKNCR